MQQIKMENILETKNLSVAYEKIDVLNHISISIKGGDFVGIIGPNGGGKTTLIKAILGLIPLSNGSVKLFGKDIKEFKEWNRIGYLPQKHSTVNLLFPATVEEVVTLGLLSQRKWPKRVSLDDKNKVTEILKTLGILELRGKMLSILSGGQQQRVFLARALVSSPDMLIFDEPSTALDTKSRESFFDFIRRLNKEGGVTIILITHDTSQVNNYVSKLLYIDKELVEQ